MVGNNKTAAASICQANNEGASTQRVNRSRQAMCAANETAQPSVKKSPRFPEAWGFISSQSPPVAIPIANHTRRSNRRRISGTITTYSAVIKAEFDAEVY